ncbi:MAG TPA: S8 family serine peptidase, partial [Verrucomicrobiae bacterium]|nr:S8 family serine peptidase [Verrucomicrobiae bacterium]
MFSAALIQAAPKTIRLRNKTIVISSAAKSAAISQAAKPVSGLFLIQFTNSIRPEWRAQLEREGVRLLRFVPDDAFVAKFQNANSAQIQAHPFVNGMVPYQPEYKMDSALRPLAAPRGVAVQWNISALISPDATPAELAQTRGLLRRVDKESALRFGHILQGAATSAQLTALAESPSVLWIEPAPKMKLFDEIGSKIVGGDDGQAGTPTLTQQLGFDGSGVKVAVADSGLMEGNAETMHPDLAGRVDDFLFYGGLTDAADEHSHGTHVAGIIAGNAATGETDENGFLYGLGVAPGSHLIVQRIFDGEGNYNAPPSFEVLTHDAVRDGADIGSNSWGDDTQGRYDLSAEEFDGLVRDADDGTPGDQPYILEFSAGNAGPGAQTIGSPAVAKNVIATGAVENDRFDLYIYDSGEDTMADFSSRGPCEDGRIKPDLVAPGTWIASLRSSLANDDNAWLPISQNYMYQGGTSQAGPHVSGAAAVFVQYYREAVTNVTPSPALVKAALINSAVALDPSGGTAAAPNNDEGWGRADLSQIIGSPRHYEFLDQSVLLTNDETFETNVLVASSDEPLKITLAYTDVPGFPAVIPALVNDLDLEVIAPDGKIYHGNQFENGESVPGAAAFDNINNVEAVHLAEPIPGEYFVRIHARNVPEDARRDTAAIDQDFALVASADIPEPGVGILFFDKKSYSAPSVMNLKLIDLDLAGQSFVNVVVHSSTESGGEILTLNAVGSGGIFSGSIPVVTGNPVSDGQLEVSHGDTIQASYQDASPVGTREATARADLVPPIITNVSATNRFGRTFISWQTDEPADSVVRFGTNSILSMAETNSILTVSHEVALGNLSAGVPYQFIIVSADDAGNASTNDNSGARFVFTPVLAGSILLVDSYTDPFFPVPPLSG